MTDVNGTQNEETATNYPVTEAPPKVAGRRARFRHRLDEAIDRMDDHLYRCRECLVLGMQLCYEGNYDRKKVELSRSALLRHELAGQSGPVRNGITRRFSFLADSA